MNHYFISDPHFGHSNIVRGISRWESKDGCRPFDTLEEHDSTIINNINDVAQKDDILWCLGDWSFGGIDNVRKYREKINCDTIYLILGNHDHKIEYDIRLQRNFYWVGHYKSIIVEKQQIIMSHYAFSVWENNNRASMHFHGHSHGNLDHTNDGKILDLCPEEHEFKPWSFQQIKEYMSSRQIVAKDHHE